MYLSGGPDLSVMISGSNEFSAGTTATLPVVVANSGLIDMKMVRNDLVTRDELPNTAKLVSVGVGEGNAPVTIKSDPQMIGDLAGGSSKTIPFELKVDSEAPSGSYSLPVTVQYTYLYFAESEGMDNLRYYYKTEERVLNLTINVRSSARLEMVRVESDHLNVGTEGYLTVTVRNIGSEDAKQGILQIFRNGNSPIIPTDSSVYLESFPQGSAMIARFKVSVSSTAEGNQVYPLDLGLRYEDPEGDTIETGRITFGVPVDGMVDFSITSEAAVLSPGEKKVVTIEYTNIGAATVYHAQARISAVDPFTSGDDTAFLGDMAPGESRIARFEITADAGATVKEYGLDSEIRFRDTLDNSLISDTMKVQVTLVEADSPLKGLLNPLSLSLVAVGFIGSVWVLRSFGRKR
jgi:S-layer domain